MPTVSKLQKEKTKDTTWVDPAENQKKQQEANDVYRIQRLFGLNHRQAKNTGEAAGMIVRRYLFNLVMQGLMGEVNDWIFNRNQKNLPDKNRTLSLGKTT